VTVIPASPRRSLSAPAIGYWICTAAIAFTFLSGGIGHLMRAPQVVQGITQLGYPVYFVTLLGVWKLLGGAAVLLPGFPLLNEWAYAGMIFDLTGAAAAHAAVGSDTRHILVPLVLAVLVVASWALRPESRRLTRALRDNSARHRSAAA
jgi:uncharacterized membrane protein YphA (DoxX/SURF4 family)